MIKKFLIHIAYWLGYYIDKKHINKKDKTPVSLSIWGLAVLQLINLLTLLIAIHLSTDYDAIDNLFGSWVPGDLRRTDVRYYLYGILFLAPFLVFNYFIVYYKNKKKDIEIYFKTFAKNKNELKKSKVIFWMYIILTFITFFSLAKIKEDRSKLDNKSIYKQK